MQPGEPDFWAPRRCLREPIPEVFEVAGLLSGAADAHMAGETRLAAELIASADKPAVRDWLESLWGKASLEIHRIRKVEGAPPVDRSEARMPSAAVKKAVVARDGYRCRFCGVPVIPAEVRTYFQKRYPAARWGARNLDQHAGFQCLWLQYDHVLPHARGGGNDLQNVLITCSGCNYGRWRYTLDEMGLIDPRDRAPMPAAGWDGLTRVLSVD